MRWALGLLQFAGFGLALAYAGLATVALVFDRPNAVEVAGAAARFGLIAFGCGAVGLVGRA